MENFKKTVFIGRNDKEEKVFCKIEYNANGNLSISGVEGPLRNGNCTGGCGQIDTCYRSGHSYIASFATEWNQEKWNMFLDIWDNYHLNYLKAGCQYQREHNWGKEKVEVVYYTLRTAVWRKIEKIKKDSIKQLKKGETVSLSLEKQKLLSLPLTITGEHNLKGVEEYYKINKKETKFANWVYPKEHPKGVLGKPCPVCGYKYGTAWLKIDVPEEVLEFLKGLPDPEVTPAWV